MEPDELAPGLFHWTAFHPRIRQRVSSYYLRDERVLIDPMLPSGGLEWLASAERGPPQTILLTNRHHYRGSAVVVEAFGAVVRASRPGMHEFGRDRPVEPFDYGDELPGRIVAHEVGAICPDETALEIGAARALACADGVVRSEMDGPLAFVPDWLLGDDPEGVKRGLRAAYRRLVEELDFDHLLLAHGLPVVGEGREQLREFVGE
jgi:hypothetical protein